MDYEPTTFLHIDFIPAILNNFCLREKKVCINKNNKKFPFFMEYEDMVNNGVKCENKQLWRRLEIHSQQKSSIKKQINESIFARIIFLISIYNTKFIRNTFL